MLPRMRTAGDGMESERVVVESTAREVPDFELSDLEPPSSAGAPRNRIRIVIQLFPIIIPHKERKSSELHLRKPKFVPYEPYPAAVTPMVPFKTVKKSKKRSKNNMELNTLVSQMTKMDTNLSQFKPRAKLSPIMDKSTEDDKDTPPINNMQKKIDELTKLNAVLREQLDQQVQVNKELKTMLVASMGEDLETQVQSLNDDKKHLANALLSSSQHLSTHQEQTEWLAGQCEVWRSKFLASSLMVEELANWKKVLTERVEDLQKVMNNLFDDRYRTRDMMLCTYKNLYHLHNGWLRETLISDERKNYSQSLGNLNLNATKLNSTSILELASVNLKLSENISSGVEKTDIQGLDELPSVTDAEKLAENVLAKPLELRRVIEEPVNALVNHAHTSSGSVPKPVASCLHCNGKVQLL